MRVCIYDPRTKKHMCTWRGLSDARGCESFQRVFLCCSRARISVSSFSHRIPGRRGLYEMSSLLGAGRGWCCALKPAQTFLRADAWSAAIRRAAFAILIIQEAVSVIARNFAIHSFKAPLIQARC